MLCHICNENLNHIKKGDINLYICPSCQGIALKNEDLRKLILLTKSSIKHNLTPNPTKVNIMKYSKQKIPLSKCPNCKYNLYTIENKGLELDYCINCKIFWFDKNELSSFIERYKNGRIIVLESSEYTNDDILNLILSFTQ